MGRILYFIFDGMTDYEVTFSMHLLGADAGMEVITVAYENSDVVGRTGAIYKPHKKVEEVLTEDAEGLVICGGWYGEMRPELERLIVKLDQEGKLLAGICGAGTYLLAEAGVLRNKRYTSPISEWTEKHREVFGAVDPFPRENFVETRVVKDGNVITGLGHAFVDFGIEICDWFNLLEDERERAGFVNIIKG